MGCREEKGLPAGNSVLRCWELVWAQEEVVFGHSQSQLTGAHELHTQWPEWHLGAGSVCTVAISPGHPFHYAPSRPSLGPALCAVPDPGHENQSHFFTSSCPDDLTCCPCVHGDGVAVWSGSAPSAFSPFSSPQDLDQRPNGSILYSALHTCAFTSPACQVLGALWGYSHEQKQSLCPQGADCAGFHNPWALIPCTGSLGRGLSVASRQVSMWS